MPIPKIYSNSGEGAITSYNFYDLSAGTGYKTFYGMKSINKNISGYNLVTEPMSSLNINTSRGYTISDVNSALNLNFDCTFPIQMTIQGDAYINIPIAGQGNTSDWACTLSGALYKVVDTTEILLGDVVVYNMTIDTVADPEWALMSGVIKIPTTIIKPTDKLRLNIKTNSPGASKYTLIFHDPFGYSNIDADIYDTKLYVSLPFRIGL